MIVAGVIWTMDMGLEFRSGKTGKMEFEWSGKGQRKIFFGKVGGGEVKGNIRPLNH